jgi:diaminohydroxyphosphoribosylaminopyrimidine deaminase / 5-amino-6-(5-phosphoribosylamino)uracil reductase
MGHEQYMRRCFDLARLGAGRVSPNPMVGAVLVWQDRIIGEGYHRAYGQAHAEVNALRSVSEHLRAHIQEATLYVSLEPCCIFGRTPPCTDLIQRERIPRVVISCRDQTAGVSGQGVAILEGSGIEVTEGVLEDEGLRLASIRNTFVREERPYILLKYARTDQGFFAAPDRGQFFITGPFTQRMVHRWRTHTDAILVGSQTVLSDDPQLTDRFFGGPQPLRIVVDRSARLPEHHRLFQDDGPTLLVGTKPSPPFGLSPKTEYLFLPESENQWRFLFRQLAQRSISHLTVEGGARILNDLLQQELWDEARIGIGPAFLPEGIPAPVPPVRPANEWPLGNDRIQLYYRS